VHKIKLKFVSRGIATVILILNLVPASSHIRTVARTHALSRVGVRMRDVLNLVHVRMSMYSSTEYYCKLDRDKTGASGPRGGCARDFVDFEKIIDASRARGAAARV
jgi:hypothetical protein